MERKFALRLLEIFYFTGLVLRFLISGRIHYWSNYLFLAWFSLVYLLALLLKRVSFPIPKLLKLFLGLFFGGLILSMPFGIQPLSSARELNIFLGYLFLFLAGLELLNPQNLKKLFRVIILSALIQALFGFRQYFTGLETLKNLLSQTPLAQMEQIQLKRIFGFTFSPDFFAGFLGASLLLLIGSAKNLLGENQRRKNLSRLIALLTGILILLPMLLSKSLGGFLAFLVGILVWILLQFSQTRFKKKLLMLILAMLIFAGAIFSFFIYHRRELIFQSQNNPVLLRLYNFQAGFKVYLEKPVLGVGLGNFWIAYPKYRQAQANEVRYAHNNFIQVLAEAGPIAETGLFLLILYFLLGLKKIWAKNDDHLTALFGALVALFCHWLWDFGLYVPELSSLFFVLLAGFAIQLNSENPQKISRTTLIPLGLLILFLWLFAGWIFAEHRLIKKAEQFFKQRSIELAESYARSALKILPDDDYAYALLAFCASQKSAPESVVVGYFQKAISLNPRFAFWHRDLGDYYFHQGKLNLSQQEYLRALKLYPNSIEINTKLARGERLQGNLISAENYARKALTISGDQRLVLWELAKIKRAKAEPEEMLKILKELWENYQDQEAKKILENYPNEGAK